MSDDRRTLGKETKTRYILQGAFLFEMIVAQSFKIFAAFYEIRRAASACEWILSPRRLNPVHSSTVCFDVSLVLFIRLRTCVLQRFVTG